MFALHAGLLSARKWCDVVPFDKNKTLPRLHYKICFTPFMKYLWGVGMGGAGWCTVPTR